MCIELGISDESLKNLDSVIFNNPKHSPTMHPSDYTRWLEFILSCYKNDDSFYLDDFEEYLVENGYEKFPDSINKMIESYINISDFIEFITNKNSRINYLEIIIQDLLEKYNLNVVDKL